jgi:LuxR family transcriptional regulator, maltose regulon positive regulatory protein
VNIRHTATCSRGRADSAGANAEIRELFADRPHAKRDWHTATAALTPLLDVPRGERAVVVTAFLLGAVACDALGDADAVGRAVERALELAEADRMLFPLLIQPEPGEPAPPCEPLTRGEARVLRYLPSNLSAREIADELYLSLNTVKTHQRHLYRKLGARSRTQAVDRARALGLLTAPGAPERPARAAR